MRPLARFLLAALLLTLTLPLADMPASPAHAAASAAFHLAAAPRGALRISVEPSRINVGRDAVLRISVTSGNGMPVVAQVSIIGAGNPVLRRASRAALSLTVHATALGLATVQAIARGYPPALRQIPIVAGPPASVAAIMRGMSILIPHAKPRAGSVGTDLFQDYHALTARAQLASLALRDGTLVDLNSNTDVLIKDPLHTQLNRGELFLEVVHGSTSHQVQAGTAVAATKGTRLDVRYAPGSRTAVVTVIEGRVLVTNHGKSTLVGAGQQTIIVGNRPPSAPKPVDVRTVVGWVKALPNSSPTTVPPIPSLAPAPPMSIPTPPKARTPNLTLTGTLASVTTVSGTVLITATTILPAGASLTIAPGTLVEFGPGALLAVDGTLKAVGTGIAPITFTSSAAHPRPGDWQALRIENSGAAGTVLDHVQAFYGGHDIFYNVPGMVLVRTGANIRISNSLFADGASGAIYVDDPSRPSIANCIFAADAGSPISAAVDLFGQITGTQLAPSQDPVVARPGAIAHDAAWLPSAAPIVLTGTVILNAGTVLTIAPGTTIAMGPGALFAVDGTLTAIGTAAAPIQFTSAAAQPQPGDWQALRIENATAKGSVLDHLQLFYGGYDRFYNVPGALLVRTGANIAIRNSLVAQDASGGIYVDDATRPLVTNCLFAGDVGSPIDASIDTLALFTQIHLAGGQSPIVARPGTIGTSATWLPSEVPVVLTGTVILAAKTVLTIAPGTVITFGPGALFAIDGTLKAVGTASAPIAFTSAAAQPKPGDWQALRIENASASATVLSDVQFLYGGYDQFYNVPGMLLIRSGANIAVSDTVLADDSRGAITVDDASRPTITAAFFSSDNGNPLNVAVDALSLFTNLQFGPGQAPIVARPGTISTSQLWQPLDVPVVLTGTVILAAGTTLTIAPGATVRFGPAALLAVDGTLHAAGSAAAPITFTSAMANPRAGDWQAIRVENASAAATVFSNVRILYGGYDRFYNVPGMLLIRTGANISVTRSRLAQGSNGGIYADDASRPSITGDTFAGIAGAAVLVPATDQALVHDNTFGPGQRQVEIHP